MGKVGRPKGSKNKPKQNPKVPSLAVLQEQARMLGAKLELPPEKAEAAPVEAKPKRKRKYTYRNRISATPGKPPEEPKPEAPKAKRAYAKRGTKQGPTVKLLSEVLAWARENGVQSVDVATREGQVRFNYLSAKAETWEISAKPARPDIYPSHMPVQSPTPPTENATEAEDAAPVTASATLSYEPDEPDEAGEDGEGETSGVSDQLPDPYIRPAQGWPEQ